MDFDEELRQLSILIKNLPPSLPSPDAHCSNYVPFRDFQLDPEQVADFGEVGAVSNVFKSIFGWKTRSSGDGIIPIRERGDGLLAVTEYLRFWHDKYPGDAVLVKWARDVRKGVEKVYATEGCELPSLTPSSSPPPEQLSRKRGRSPSVESVGYSESVTALGEDEKVGDDDAGEEDTPSKAKGGRNPIELLNKACAKFKAQGKRSAKLQPHWRCVGEGCGYTASGNPSINRVYPHAMKCKFLQASHPELHAAINDVQAEEALGAKLADEEEISEPAKKKHHGEGTVEERCRDEGRARFQNEVNHAIMVFCCVCNIPLHALDTPQWKNLVCKLNPRYIPLSSNTFAEKYIPQEAALVKKKVVKILKKSRNLTVSFDGGSTRKDSVYFVHVTTPEREHFFIDGHVGTAEKHDAMWIYKRLKQSIAPFEHLVSAFVSDRASNAIGGRELMVKDDPVALDLGDSCHHLHNTSKDVSKLPEFGWMHKRLKATLAHFSKSTYSRAMLTASGEEEGEKVYALKKMGKTRFGSSRPSVVSLLAVLGHVRKLVQNGTISFKSKTLSALFSKGGRFAYSRLETALQQYADITEPICKAICALEASHATLSDVFIFFLAIAAHLHEQFNDPLSGISSKLADNVTTIFNDRFDQIFSEEHDEYFVCFALDPRWPMSDVLLIAPTMNPSIVIPRPGTDLSVTNPRAYDRVKQYLKDRLRTRIFPHYDRVLSTHGIDEVKRIYGPIHALGKDGAIKALRTQLKDYWRREYPFHEDVTGGDSLAWWQKLIEHPRANVLAMLAIELFFFLPNSMPDERTGSKFTWMNSALRGNQHATNLVYMVQIGQWYRRTHEKEKPVRRPAVKFRDIKQDMLDRIQSSSRAARHGGADDNVETGEASDSDTDDDDDGDCTAYDENVRTGPTKVFSMPANLRAPALRDLLSDKPLVTPALPPSTADDEPTPSGAGGDGIFVDSDDKWDW